MEKENKSYKVKLIDYIFEHQFETFLNEQKIEYKKIEYFDGYRIYKLMNIDEKVVDVVRNLSCVKRIEIMRKYYLNFKSKEVNNIEYPKNDEQHVPSISKVGIIDNGIADLDVFKNWVEHPKKKYCKEEIFPSHGTFVAGVILYADKLDNSSWTKTNKLKIFDGCVVPNFDIKQLEEDELFQRIIQLVSENSHIKVWNLAISIRYPVSPEYISDFGKILDYIQSEYDVLICKSCGNGDFAPGGIQQNLILQGSDTALGLVIAACDKNRQVSSFSLSGVGHKILTKPDLAMYGGNLYINEENKKKVEPVFSFTPSGKIASSFGTSFATARITSIAGNILSEYEGISVLLLKAVLLYNSEGGMKHHLGYGCVKNFQEIKKSMENLFVYEDQMEEAEIKIKIPYSNNLLKVALTCDLILDYENDEEYILGDVGIKFPEIIKCKNKYKEYSELNSVKKFEYTMEEKEGEIEVILYRRWRDINTSKKIENLKKKSRFCLICEK